MLNIKSIPEAYANESKKPQAIKNVNNILVKTSNDFGAYATLLNKVQTELDAGYKSKDISAGTDKAWQAAIAFAANKGPTADGKTDLVPDTKIELSNLYDQLKTLSVADDATTLVREVNETVATVETEVAAKKRTLDAAAPDVKPADKANLEAAHKAAVAELDFVNRMKSALEIKKNLDENNKAAAASAVDPVLLRILDRGNNFEKNTSPAALSASGEAVAPSGLDAKLESLETFVGKNEKVCSAIIDEVGNVSIQFERNASVATKVGGVRNFIQNNPGGKRVKLTGFNPNEVIALGKEGLALGKCMTFSLDKMSKFDMDVASSQDKKNQIHMDQIHKKMWIAKTALALELSPNIKEAKNLENHHFDKVSVVSLHAKTFQSLGTSYAISADGVLERTKNAGPARAQKALFIKSLVAGRGKYENLAAALSEIHADIEEKARKDIKKDPKDTDIAYELKISKKVNNQFATQVKEVEEVLGNKAMGEMMNDKNCDSLLGKAKGSIAVTAQIERASSFRLSGSKMRSGERQTFCRGLYIHDEAKAGSLAPDEMNPKMQSFARYCAALCDLTKGSMNTPTYKGWLSNTNKARGMMSGFLMAAPNQEARQEGVKELGKALMEQVEVALALEQKAYQLANPNEIQNAIDEHMAEKRSELTANAYCKLSSAINAGEYNYFGNDRKESLVSAAKFFSENFYSQSPKQETPEKQAVVDRHFEGCMEKAARESFEDAGNPPFIGRAAAKQFEQEAVRIEVEKGRGQAPRALP